MKRQKFAVPQQLNLCIIVAINQFQTFTKNFHFYNSLIINSLTSFDKYNCTRSNISFQKLLHSKEIQGHFYNKNIVKNCTILNKKKRNECFSALLVVLEEQLGGSFAFLLALLVLEQATFKLEYLRSKLINCICKKLKPTTQTGTLILKPKFNLMQKFKLTYRQAFHDSRQIACLILKFFRKFNEI